MTLIESQNNQATDMPNENVVTYHIIYHNHCVDGYASQFVFSTYYPFTSHHSSADEYSIRYYPADYNKPIDLINPKKQDKIFILDFSVSPFYLGGWAEQVNEVWVIDHHKTAFEMYEGIEFQDNVHIKLDQNYCGCVLTWAFCTYGEPANVHRASPLLAYIQDRDLWKFHLPDSEAINALIGATEKTYEAYERLQYQLRWERHTAVDAGTMLLKQYKSLCDAAAKEARPFKITTDSGEFNGLIANCHGAFASNVGEILAKQSGTFGATYFQDKEGNTKYSLRSVAPDGVDVAKIAEHFGGGGHKHAAGFLMIPTPDQDFNSTVTLWTEQTTGDQDAS